MAECIAELDTANRLLDAALERYLNACTAVQSRCAKATARSDTARMLAHRVVRELTSASSFETKIKQVKSIIGQTSNLATASIHALPSELLARIFLLTVGDSCGIGAGSSKSRYMPRYPDFLSHVCSHWRSIAIDFPALWTHIDLVYFHSSDQKYVDRAKVFASRAGQLPLEVHIRAPTSPDFEHDPDALYNFLPFIATRTRSLELITADRSADFDEELFERLFKILESATLSHFGITDHADYTPVNICAIEDKDEDEDEDEDMAPEYECQYLNLSPSLFEGVLLPVRVLKLDGLYPHWASQAYHGLVELRLYRSRGRDCSVTATQLHGVLGSSPGLVTLLFELEIVDDRAQRPIAPVYLEELEVLRCDIGEIDSSAQLEVFLGLFTPGLKQLHLTLYLLAKLPLSESDSVIAAFLKSANISRLYLRGIEGPLVLDDLFGLIPQVRVLTLAGNFIRDPIGPFSSTSQLSNSRLDLDALYIEQGRFDLNSLCLLAKASSPKAIVLWQTEVCWDKTSLDFDELMEDDGDMDLEVVAEAQVQAALREFCPLVTYAPFGRGSPSRGLEFRDIHY